MSLRAWITKTRSRRIAVVLVLLVVGGQFVRSNVGTFVVVDGVSMCPTFQPNDVVLTRSTGIRAERGDVVIVTDERGDQVIKRVIGLPGESLTVYRGAVFINRRKLIEPYLPKHTYTFKSNQRNERAESWQLGEDEYFVLGDNRSHSTDSRHYGPVKRARFLGTVSTPGNSPEPGFDSVVLLDDSRSIASPSGQRDQRQSDAHAMAAHPDPGN